MNNEVWVLQRMYFSEIQAVVGVYADKALPMRLVDETLDAEIRRDYAGVENIVVTPSWKEEDGKWWSVTHYEWDFQGDHHAMHMERIYALQSFSIIA